MKLGIMQPYFFPYCGYFHLINQVDEWVVFDVVNYKRRSWMNRNRILHPDKEWQYVNYPVKKAPSGTKIENIQGKDHDKARAKIVAQLDFYKKKAPYTDVAVDVVNEVFSRCVSHSLVDVCVSGLTVVCERLDIEFNYCILSKLNIQLPEISKPGQWALEISKALNATEYLNPIGGQEIFNEEAFRQSNIALNFSDPAAVRYDVSPFKFVSNLSILDVMCWMSPQQIKNQLDSLTDHESNCS